MPMKKDILNPKVEDVAVAIVPETETGTGEESWYVYVVNMKEHAIHTVLVSSKGYGIHNGKKVRTSSLSHFFEQIEKLSCRKVELIPENLISLSNEYWVSFYIERQIYDRKYVFLAESLTSDNLIEIPILGKKGVMIG